MVLLTLLTLLTGLLEPGLQRDRGNPRSADGLTLDGAMPIIDNQRASVWDFTWTRGVAEAMERVASNAV